MWCPSSSTNGFDWTCVHSRVSLKVCWKARLFGRYSWEQCLDEEEGKGASNAKQNKNLSKAEKMRMEREREARELMLPRDLVTRMYGQRHTCARPECERQFWGKGRVVWKYPLLMVNQPPASPDTELPFGSLSEEDLMNHNLLSFDEEEEKRSEVRQILVVPFCSVFCSNTADGTIVKQ